MYTYVPQLVPTPQPPPPPTTPPPVQSMWTQKFPSLISGLFCFFQAIVSIVVIGCEVVGMLIDLVTATIFVGIWAGFFFIIAWVSQSIACCCLRGRACATYSLVMQCIALVFAGCVIGFDAYFIGYPKTCYFPTSTCTANSTRGIFYSVDNFNNIKIPLIKGQLAAGSVMFCLCLVNIFLFIGTAIRVRYTEKSPNIYPQTYVPNPYGMLTAPSMRSFHPVSGHSHSPGRITEVACPTCSSKLGMTVLRQVYM